MAEINYQQAVQTLQEHLGGRYEGAEAEGRDEIVAVLKRELGYSAHDADEAIDAMVASGRLRYHHPTVDASDYDTSPVVPVGIGTGGSSPGAAPSGEGYWQIGADDSGAEERKGQVRPL